jgi:hypothetical protein
MRSPDRDDQYLMIDSTIVRAHQQAGGRKRGGARPTAGAFLRRTDDQDPYSRWWGVTRRRCFLDQALAANPNDDPLASVWRSASLR